MQKTIAKGSRLVELLKQGQYAPVPVERQVVSIYFGTKGYLDEVPLHDVKRFEKEVLEFVEVKYNQIYKAIKKDKDISKDTDELLKKAGQEFLSVFKKN